MSKVARFRKRSYLLHVARAPGDEAPVTQPPLWRGVDEEHRTNWFVNLEDEAAGWKFLLAYVGVVIPATSVMVLQCNGREVHRRLKPRLTRKGYHTVQESLLSQLAAWRRCYPEASEAKLIQLVLRGRKAGTPPHLINYKERANILHQRYQALRNAHTTLEGRNRSLVKRVAELDDRLKAYSRDLPVFGFIVEQYLAAQRALADNGHPHVYAVGLRYDTASSPRDLLASLVYHGRDRAAAIDGFRARVKQLLFTGQPVNLVLYIHSDDPVSDPDSKLVWNTKPLKMVLYNQLPNPGI
jgi:hypothetical protein